jgi:hypothetical protein
METEQKGPEIDRDMIQKLHDKLDKVLIGIERSNISDYVTMIKRPWRYLLITFASGIARGVGIAIGLTIIAAVALFILTKILANLVTLPFIGQMLAQLVEYVNQYLKEGTKINLQ